MHAVMQSPTATEARLSRTLNERQEFLIFIKILFLLLSLENKDALRVRAKQIIAKCTRRNRLGHTDYANLQYAVASRIRYVVGEALWEHAIAHLDDYCMRLGVHRPPGSVV